MAKILPVLTGGSSRYNGLGEAYRTVMLFITVASLYFTTPAADGSLSRPSKASQAKFSPHSVCFFVTQGGSILFAYSGSNLLTINTLSKFQYRDCVRHIHSFLLKILLWIIHLPTALVLSLSPYASALIFEGIAYSQSQ